MSEPENFAIIIGAMKSGTTTLFEVLSQHPEIAPCREKEPFFFASSERSLGSREAYQQLWDWNPGQHKIALEASTDYTKLPFVTGVPDRMAALEGFNFRFIYVMRNPFKRIESHVVHSIATKSEIGGIVESDRDFSLDAGVTEVHIAFSRYAYQMDAFASKFGKDRLLPVVLENYSAQPEAVLRDCCQFLGVDATYQFNDTDRFTGRSRDLLPPSPLWASLQKNRALKAIARPMICEKLRAKIRREIAIRTIGRYRLNANERQFIADKLRPDYQRLMDEYGIDCSKVWGV